MAGRRGPRNLVFSGSRKFFPPPCSLPSNGLFPKNGVLHLSLTDSDAWQPIGHQRVPTRRRRPGCQGILKNQKRAFYVTR
jgi:hypothetical protein